MLSWQYPFCMLSIGTRLRGYDGFECSGRKKADPRVGLA